MASEIDIVFNRDAEMIKRWDTSIQVFNDRTSVKFKHSSGASIMTNEPNGYIWEWPVADGWAHDIAPTIQEALAEIKKAQESKT